VLSESFGTFVNESQNLKSGLLECYLANLCWLFPEALDDIGNTCCLPHYSFAFQKEYRLELRLYKVTSPLIRSEGIEAAVWDPFYFT